MIRRVFSSLLALVVCLRASSMGVFACPETITSCATVPDNTFKTYFEIEFDMSGILNPIQLQELAEQVVQAYDFIAGTVCDPCARRLVIDQGLVFADRLSTEGTVILEFTLLQSGTCDTAFDTGDGVVDVDSGAAFAVACGDGFVVDPTCCCACGAESDSLTEISSEDFRTALESLVGSSILGVQEYAPNPSEPCSSNIEEIRDFILFCFDYKIEGFDDKVAWLRSFLVTFNAFAEENCLPRRAARLFFFPDTFGEDCTGTPTCYSIELEIAALVDSQTTPSPNPPAPPPPTMTVDGVTIGVVRQPLTGIPGENLLCDWWSLDCDRRRRLGATTTNIVSTRPQDSNTGFTSEREMLTLDGSILNSKVVPSFRRLIEHQPDLLYDLCLCPVSDDFDPPLFASPSLESFEESWNLELNSLGFGNVTEIRLPDANITGDDFVTCSPTSSPSTFPTTFPSMLPSTSPTSFPSVIPTDVPTKGKGKMKSKGSKDSMLKSKGKGGKGGKGDDETNSSKSKGKKMGMMKKKKEHGKKGIARRDLSVE